METPPLLISSAAQPVRVLAAYRAIDARLVRRGFHFDADAERAGRQLFLRLLAPHAHAFLQRAPENVFNALALDALMQDEAIAAFAHRHGPGSERRGGLRMFAFYAKIGPAMWQTIEQDRERTKTTFAILAR